MFSKAIGKAQGMGVIAKVAFNKAKEQGMTTPNAAPVTAGANKSASNRSRGMQNNVGMQEAQAGTVGSVNTNMINAELQNDDLLGIYTKGT